VYPLKGSGIVLLLLCRRKFSDYFGETLPFYFRWRCCRNITGSPVAAFSRPHFF
jgi:hypothetical protein